MAERHPITHPDEPEPEPEPEPADEAAVGPAGGGRDSEDYDEVPLS